ncbi:M56 family metallopeptidase [Flavobacterium sp. HNIBRBA15423]|uniref:M56 family metallopeptidase n=1 Tax=Flavobacterium sp. HNIBRBA15423 TaxID=3458683 RepID=UPI004044461D
MINFLIESTIGLIVFLLFYRLFLETEKTHQFNRFYLLGSILISFIIPFISIEITQEIKAISLPTNIPIIGYSKNKIPIKVSIDYTPTIIWSFYTIITLASFFKFFKNLFYFKKAIQSNEKVNYKRAILVLLDQKTVPHTFLNYIFLNKESHNNKTIENELYEHELTHVNEKHSYDILFIEILKAIFWFNPIFSLYKKSIQLNHEFIADRNVLKTHTNVSSYQSLLLDTNENKTYYLASNLNYLITKKRLIMMTKTTSKRKSILKKIVIAPIVLCLVFFLCFKTIAQTKNKIQKNSKTNVIENVINNESAKTSFSEKTDIEKYFKNTIFIVKNEAKKILKECNFSELTDNDKKTLERHYFLTIKRPAKKLISFEEFEAFKNSRNFAVWINGKNISNSELDKYNESDFVYFTNSFVYKNARSEKFPQDHQVSLYTKEGFLQAFPKKEEMAQPTITLVKQDDNIIGIVL